MNASEALAPFNSEFAVYLSRGLFGSDFLFLTLELLIYRQVLENSAHFGLVESWFAVESVYLFLVLEFKYKRLYLYEVVVILAACGQ